VIYPVDTSLAGSVSTAELVMVYHFQEFKD
jgi:hypothetical protein